MSNLLSVLGATEADLLTASGPDEHGVRIGSFGKQGAGKSHLMMSRPGPLMLFDFEHNLDKVLPSFPGKQVIRKVYPEVLDGSTKTAKEIADRFREEYFGTLAKLKKSGMGPKDVTLGIDSLSAVWDLFQLAYIDFDPATGKAAPKAYEKANALYRALLVEAAYHEQVLICTSRVSEAWSMVDNGKGGTVLGPTGTDKAGWNKHTGGDLDIVIEVQRKEKVVAGKVSHYRSYRVTKCTSNDKLYGKRLEDLPGGDDINYDSLMWLVSNWEG